MNEEELKRLADISVEGVAKETLAKLVINNDVVFQALTLERIDEDECREVFGILGRTLAESAIARAEFVISADSLEGDEMNELMEAASRRYLSKNPKSKKLFFEEKLKGIFGQKLYDKLQLERLK